MRRPRSLSVNLENEMTEEEEEEEEEKPHGNSKYHAGQYCNSVIYPCGSLTMAPKLAKVCRARATVARLGASKKGKEGTSLMPMD